MKKLFIFLEILIGLPQSNPGSSKFTCFGSKVELIQQDFENPQLYNQRTVGESVLISCSVYQTHF
ncbi:unnamed protein product [Paramecium octaurelia]|uniref:Uncharacterized protein n=1 Tax=Paramecium octaurelia TaxID=43137 RepID=A0A8S1WH47_PAROT|nr:unnamed protein product [Paramecium octaurelia]